MAEPKLDLAGEAAAAALLVVNAARLVVDYVDVHGEKDHFIIDTLRDCIERLDDLLPENTRNAA